MASQGAASHTRQEAWAVLTFRYSWLVWAPARMRGGGLYPPSPAGRLSPGLPMLEGRAGPLPEWAYPSALWEEFSRDRNKVSQDPRLCGGCRDILLSPSPIWLHVGQDIQGFGTQEEVASDGKSQQQGLYFSTTPSQPWGQGQGDMS